MCFNLITDFKGEIFGVKTNNQAIFNSMSFLYDEMLERSDIFNDNIAIKDFIIDLLNAFERQYDKEDISINDIEEQLLICINGTGSFSELEFEVFGDSSYFVDINEKIKNVEYLI